MDKNKRELEIKELAKQKFLLQMQKEIETIEYEIENEKKINFKKKTIRSLLISARRVQLLAPYIMCFCLTTGSCKLISGSWPFIRDEKKITSNTMIELDNLGNIKKEQQYGKFDNEQDILKYYTKWKELDNSHFIRNIELYKIKDDTSLDEIQKILAQENIRIEDYTFLEDKISDIEEIKNNIQENQPIIEVKLYHEDKEDYVIRKEGIVKNVIVSILYFFVINFTEFSTIWYRMENSKFNYTECINDIRKKYRLLDKEVLTKKLKIKKENYHRLTR